MECVPCLIFDNVDIHILLSRDKRESCSLLISLNAINLLFSFCCFSPSDVYVNTFTTGSRRLVAASPTTDVYILYMH